MESNVLVKEIAKVLDEKKAIDITAIKTEEVTIVSDYFIIASGTSNTHAKSLADDVEYEIKERCGIDPEHIRVCDPSDPKELEKVIGQEIASDVPSVIIVDYKGKIVYDNEDIDLLFDTVFEDMEELELCGEC